MQYPLVFATIGAVDEHWLNTLRFVLTPQTMATDAQENFKQRVSQFDFIRFVMSDFHGIQKGKVVPARNAAALVDSGTTVWCGRLFSQS